MWQLRLLLWKDYLLRKRKPVSVGAILWAGIALCSLVIVRFNVDREPQNTCVFPARALPSAGLAESLQSLVCSVNNECGSVEQYEPIPSYKSSRFKDYKNQISSLISDPDVLDVGRGAPKAARLLATMAKALNPEMLGIILDDGLTVSELFQNPKSTKQYLHPILKNKLEGEQIDVLFDSKINLDYVLELASSGQASCDNIVFQKLVRSPGSKHAETAGLALCDLPDDVLEETMKTILFQLNIQKFTRLVGDIFENLTGNKSVSEVSDMLGAVLRLTDLKKYWPSELQFIGPDKDDDFSYVQMDIIINLLDSLDPVLGRDSTFVSLKNSILQIKSQLSGFNSIVNKDNENSKQVYSDTGNSETDRYLNKLNKLLNTTLSIAKKSTNSFDPISILEMALEFGSKMLSPESLYKSYYYLTLGDKMLVLAKNTAEKNMNMEKLFQETCKRHPNALDIVSKLGPDIVNKMLDSLTDANRVQILTRKIFKPGQMFCDLYKVQTFLKISQKEASQMKPLLCSQAWKSFIADAINTFGVNSASKTMDEISSMVIADTLGNKVSDRFITIPKAMDNLRNILSFIKNSTLVERKPSTDEEWNAILPKQGFDKIVDVFKRKKSWDLLLVTVHTAVAREVIAKNNVVEGQLSPLIIKIWYALKALADQVKQIPITLFQDMQKSFPDLLKTAILTAKNANKTTNFILSDHEKHFCDAAEMCNSNECIKSSYISKVIEYPNNSNMAGLTKVICNLSKAFNEKLKGNPKDDHFMSMVRRIVDGSLTVAKNEEVDWNSFIKNMQDLYKEMSGRFTFLISFVTTKTSEELQKDLNEIGDIYSNVDPKELAKMSMSLFLRILNTLNSPLFEMGKNFPQWKRFIAHIPSISGLFHTSNIFIGTIDASFSGSNSHTSKDLPLTADRLNKFIYGSGKLMKDIVTNIMNKKIDWENFERSGFPCNLTVREQPFKDLSTDSENALSSAKDFLCLSPDVFMEWQNYSYIEDLKSKNISAVEEKPNQLLILGQEFNDFVDTFSLLISRIENLVTKKIFSDVINSWEETIDLMTKSDAALTQDFLRIIDVSLKSQNKYKVVDANSSIGVLWEQATSCKEECEDKITTAIHYSFYCFSQASTEIVKSLTQYFVEVSSEDANFLQLLGFTKGTGLYVLHAKLPQLIHVLTESYLDHAYMKQIYTSVGKKFWDCERLLEGLVIGEKVGISNEEIQTIKPYVCPSILHWVTLPLNENVILDVFSKSQYVYFSQPVSTYNSTFENLYDQSVILSGLIQSANFTDRNFTLFTDEWINKFKNISQIIGNEGGNDLQGNVWKNPYISETLNTIIAARFTIQTKSIIENLIKLNDTGNYSNNKDYKTFIKLLDRRFAEINKIFLYATTMNMKNASDVKDFSLLKSMDQLCKSQIDSWLVNNKTLEQFCALDYKMYLQKIESVDEQIISLYDFIKNVQEKVDSKSGTKSKLGEVLNLVFDYEKENSIARLYTYERELKISGFLQYLDSVMQHRILQLSFISGEEWWTSLKQIYSGPFVSSLIEFLENSPDVASQFIQNLSKFKPVRFIKDININDTSLICGLNMSEYIPDDRNVIENLKSKMCSVDSTKIYHELKQLLFAAQIYDDETYQLDPYEGDHVILSRMENLEGKIISLIEKDIKEPALPKWIQENHKQFFNKLNINETKKEMINFVSHNFVDATTLFTNSSSLGLPSSITPWIKQINLQLIKSDEYTIFICELPHLNETEINTSLTETFHWDLAVSEIALRRNYTWSELNKALNEMIDIVKLYSEESYNRNSKKLQNCLIPMALDIENDSPINTAALFAALGSKVMKIIQIFTPQIKNIENVKDNFKSHEILINIMDSLPICNTFSETLSNVSGIETKIKNLNPNMSLEVIEYFLKGKIDLHELNKSLSCKAFLSCNPDILMGNCKDFESLLKYINSTIVQQLITNSKDKIFWEMTWANKIAAGFETLLNSFSQILINVNPIDIKGVTNGDVESTVNLALLLLNKNFTTNIYNSLNEILDVLKPILKESNINEDLRKLNDGLNGIRSLQENVISNININGPITTIFKDIKSLQDETKPLLDFSSSDIETASLQFKTVLNSKDKYKGIKYYICDENQLRTILPSNMSNQDMKTISTKLCNLGSNESKELATILMNHLNSSFLLNTVTEEIVQLVMDASNLTLEEGKQVIEIMGKAIKIAPSLKGSFENISSLLSNEPVIASLRSAPDISSLLSKPVFLKDIGNMMCGKPFQTNVNRFYKTIAAVQDTIVKPDQKQLKSLPTNYCRSLYQQIINMQGGKILWSYMKPLIMGKILYTPPTAQVDEIIKAVNKTFDSIADITNLLSGFSESFESLDQIKTYKSGLKNLQKLAKEPFFSKLLNIEGGDFNPNEINIDIDQTLEQFGGDGLGSLLKRASQITHCISLDRFVPVENEKALETEASNLAKINEFLIGIVFVPSSSDGKSSSKNITYKIRMDIDNVPSTSRIKNQFWIPGPDGNFLENLRYFRGFIQMQDMIDKAIIKTQSNHKIVKRDTEPVNLNENQTWPTYSQQMAYPCWVNDDFQRIMYESQALIIAFFFCLILSVSSISRNLVWEKESGNTDLMCIMGMKREWHTISWFLVSIIEVILAMIVLLMVLKFGRLLPKSDPFLLFLFLFNFGVSITAFSYMLTGIFKSASLAAVSGAILYLLTFMPYILIISLEAGLSLHEKLLTSLSMSTGFCYGLLFIGRFEVQGTGLQWDNVWVSPQPGDRMNVGASILIVLFDTILYCFIAWLINYYRYQNIVTSGSVSNTKHFAVSHQSTKKGTLEVGVTVKNLSKTFNKKVRAVDNVSIELYKSQITTLLGHNGAGKTTLIKILTGVIQPDSGEIIMHKNESNKSKKNHIGLCPQSDVLLECLTAREHLSYYAQLKTGLREDQVKDDIENMIQCLHLDRKLCNEPVFKLSGGTRRRLSVGLAFVTNPNLVILDEPSSGVDPVARRDIWSMICNLREGRTVLLTTHHLDEAELLSDSLLIMHQGKLCASGSPLELKHKYGDGYKLTVSYPLEYPLSCTIDDTTPSNISHLMDVVKKTIPNARLIDVHHNDVDINLPFNDSLAQTNDFYELSCSLEDKASELNYSFFSMDCSSLEQVFIKICDSLNKSSITASNGTNENSHKVDILGEKHLILNSVKPNGKNQPKTKSVFSKEYKMTYQIPALLQKRYLHYKRDLRLLLNLFVLPVFFAAVAMGFSLIRPPSDSEEPLVLSSSLYSSHSAEFISPISMYSNPVNQSVISILANMEIKYGKKLHNWNGGTATCECENSEQICRKSENSDNRTVEHEIVGFPSEQDILKWSINTHQDYIEKRYGGWSSFTDEEKETLIFWYNNKGHHAMATYLNTLNNAIYKLKLGDDKAEIITYNHPIKLSPEQLSQSSLLQHVADVGISVILMIGFTLVPAAASVYLVPERTSQQKRLQLLSGVSPFRYWFSSLIFDMGVIIIVIIETIIILEIFGLPVYVSRNNLVATIVILFVYGLSSSSLVYILEKCFVDGSLANMIIFCGCVFVGTIGQTILLIIDILSKSQLADDARWYLHKFFLVWPQFALGDALVQLSANTIQADILKRFGMDTYQNPLIWKLAGRNCLALFLTMFLFFGINMLIEYNWFSRFTKRFTKKPTPITPIDEDCDVSLERRRIEMSSVRSYANNGYSGSLPDVTVKGANHNGIESSDVLQTISLHKEYQNILGKKVAVENLTMGVKIGECFGLLGINGAGKSTTFKMLTGEVLPSSGNIYVNGELLKNDKLYNGSISYCPQNDALDPLLTLEEHLLFYCKIRRIQNIDSAINESLEGFDLQDHVKQLASALSGGNKRKLCTAIALLGDAPLVLLDEPTSGMDPRARERAGASLLKASRSGRALLLSSHSLPQCERLCDKASLLHNGKMLAVGTPSHLKNRFGRGYVITIRLEDPEKMGELLHKFSECLPDNSVQACHHSTVLILIGHKSPIALSEVFKQLEIIKNILPVSDYTLNQSSLDQVFVHFAQNRSNGHVQKRNSISMSTLERHYSRPMLNQGHSSETNLVTKF